MSPEHRRCLMASEAERRRTFRGGWPDDYDWRDFAKLGYYMCEEQGYMIHCAFCDHQFIGYLRDLVIDSVEQKIKHEHKRKNIDCPFLQGRLTNNIPYVEGTEREKGPIKKRPSNYPKVVPNPAAKLNQITKSNDFITNTPRMPEYESYDTRIKTFEYFPITCPIRPKSFCEAGFLYMDEGDAVECFWCGGKLDSWESEDQPLREHAKWYPGCAFIRRNYGTEYIKTIHRENAPSAGEMVPYNSAGVEFLTQQELDEEEGKELVKRYVCSKCHKNMVNIQLFPCGCKCLCDECFASRVPPFCPKCNHVAGGYKRVELGL